jgi:hypothetical protein
MSMASSDFPWESPKSVEGRRKFDHGPGEFARVLMGEAKNSWPNFQALGVTQNASFGHGQIYRGHLTNPEILVLADQESNDDFFSTRALTGTMGQKFQTFLSALGAVNNYAIIRTLPVDTLDLSLEAQKAVALDRQSVAVRNEILQAILKQSKTKLVIALGPVAQAAIAEFNLGAIPLVKMDYKDSSWSASLLEIKKLNVLSGVVGNYNGSLTAIPREDLPVHTRWWMGTSGTRSSRSAAYTESGKQVTEGNYYKFDAPGWVNSRNYPARAENINQTQRDVIYQTINVDKDASSDQ